MRFFSEKLRNSLVFLISPILVIVGTLGGLGRYGFMDDYAILGSSLNGDFDFDTYMSQGRPFTAIYSYFTFSFIDDIDSLFYLHSLGILTLAIFSILLFTYFRGTLKSVPTLIAFSVLPILLNPGLLLLATWAVMSSIGIALFPAVAAAFLIRHDRKLMYLAVPLLLSISFLSYPPATTIFLGLPCIAWLISLTNIGSKLQQDELIQIIKKSLSCILVSGIIALMFLKGISAQYAQQSNRTELIGDISDKVYFLFFRAVPTALDFFEPERGFSNYGIFTIVSLLALTVISINRKRFFTFCLVMTVGIGGVFTANILTAENWASNRSLFAAQWFFSNITLITTFHLIYPIKFAFFKQKIFKVASILLLTAAIFHANNLLVTTMRGPQIKELDLARSAIAELNPMLKIQVKKSEWTDSISPWLIADEYGIPSTCQTWVPVPMTILILREMYPNKSFDVELVDQITSPNSIDFAKVLGNLT